MLAVPFLVKNVSDERISRLLAFCGASVIFTMASPIAWVHHYNILLPAYVVALKAGLDRWRGKTVWWWVLALLVASFVLVGYPLIPASDPTLPSIDLLQSHVLIGGFLLLIVLFIELRTPLKENRLEPLASAQ